MPDDEYDQALRTTAGKLEELESELDDAERKALNVNAQARGLIDQGEDLIEEYKGTGIGALRGVQACMDNNGSRVDDITYLLDDIEDQIDDDGRGGLSRRQVLAGLGAFGAAGAGAAVGGGVFGAASTDNSYQPEKTYGWNDVAGCLSDDQEAFIEDLAEDEGFSKADLDYSVQSDGKIVVYNSNEDGLEPIGQTSDNDFGCRVGEGTIEDLGEGLYDSLERLYNSLL